MSSSVMNPSSLGVNTAGRIAVELVTGATDWKRLN